MSVWGDGFPSFIRIAVGFIFLIPLKESVILLKKRVSKKRCRQRRRNHAAHIIQQEINETVGISSSHDRSLVVRRREDGLSETDCEIPFGHICYVFMCTGLHEVVTDTAEDVVVCTRKVVNDRLYHADAFGHGIWQPAFDGLCIVT